MIVSYCHGDALGVTILRQNASKGCNRSAYTLGLILRDCNKSESESFLRQAVENNYLPACQELLSSARVKELFGDLDHVTLQRFFDPIALNRLLGRAYLNSAGVRRVSTSHCWNPCCGRWALKATQNNSRRPTLQFPGKYLPPIEKNLERDLFRLVDKSGKRVKMKMFRGEHMHRNASVSMIRVSELKVEAHPVGVMRLVMIVSRE